MISELRFSERHGVVGHDRSDIERSSGCGNRERLALFLTVFSTNQTRLVDCSRTTEKQSQQIKVWVLFSVDGSRELAPRHDDQLVAFCC